MSEQPIPEPQVMLAPNKEIPFDYEHIQYPVLGSGKLDGMRAIIRDGGIFSRTHIRQNEKLHTYFQHVVNAVHQEGLVLDGEIWSPTLAFNQIMSAIHKPFVVGVDLQFHVFDIMTEEEWYRGTERPFLDRVQHYTDWVTRRFAAETVPSWNVIQAVDQARITTPEDLEKLMVYALSRGLEGCVIRDPQGQYKHGRATLREGLMYKFKVWETLDAQIIGFEQSTEMIKLLESERKRTASGLLKNETSRDKRQLVDAVASVHLQDREGNTFFASSGPGKVFDAAGLTWATRETFKGKWVEVRHQSHGKHKKPRMPSVIRFRPDLEEVLPKPRKPTDLVDSRGLDAFMPPEKGETHKSTVIE